MTGEQLFIIGQLMIALYKTAESRNQTLTQSELNYLTARLSAEYESTSARLGTALDAAIAEAEGVEQ